MLQIENVQHIGDCDMDRNEMVEPEQIDLATFASIRNLTLVAMDCAYTRRFQSTYH